MADLDRDTRLRAGIAAWLDVNAAPDGTYSWNRLQTGFVFEGQRMALVTQNGIRKPVGFDAAIAFTTTYTPAGGAAPYTDAVRPDGHVHYAYRRPGRSEADNEGMRRAGELGLPLVWFVGVAEGIFVAHRPVYVVGDDPASRTFAVSLEGRPLEEVVTSSMAPRREYVERLTRLRLHQPVFRAQVLRAYAVQCAVCRLRHGDLLDAAHIRPDTLGGEPVVTNGLALCKIHHAAYDRDILGVRNDFVVQVRQDVRDEQDSPMLRYGLQEMHDRRLHLPARRRDVPDRGLLADRYAAFLAAHG